jgi:hypothetical protein
MFLFLNFGDFLVKTVIHNAHLMYEKVKNECNMPFHIDEKSFEMGYFLGYMSRLSEEDDDED